MIVVSLEKPWLGRFSTITLCASVFLGLAIRAEATIGPPVKITMPTDAKQAVAGEVYDGVIEVEIGKPGRLADVKMEGIGWTILSIDAADSFEADTGRIRIPFRARPIDANERLLFSLSYEGRTVTRGFRIGPAAFARIGRAYPAAHLGPAPARVPSSDAPAPANPRGGACTSGSVTLRVTGQIVYERDDGLVVGVDAAFVQVMDEDDVVEDDCIWEGYTAVDGTFDTGQVSIDDADGPDVYVRWELDTPVVLVMEADVVGNPDYSWSTEEAGVVIGDFPGGDLSFGVLTTADAAQMPAMHIHNSIVRTHRFIETRSGINVPQVDVFWPDSDPSAEYFCFPEGLYVGPTREWREDTHAHEYGHHFECEFATLASPDYCNDICDSGDCGHCMWCEENEPDAWHEGFPNWLADSVTRSFETDYMDLNGCPYKPLFFRDGETPQMCSCGGGNTCPAGSFRPALITEGFIHALLRDMEDAEQDDHDGDGISDCMTLGAGPILQAVDLIEPETLPDFIQGFWLSNISMIDEFKKTAFNVDPSFDSGFPPDAAPPAAVTNVWSPTHPIGGGPLPCITVMWDPADDDVSGAFAYDYVWNGSPDPSLEPGFIERVFARCIASAAGPPLMPGEESFLRIRARDAVGNWGPSSAWFGPYFVNLTECATNDNGIPDVCDAYCNLVDAPIACEEPILFNYCGSFDSCGTALDCNSNAIPDDCDIAGGASADCGGDGIPDECQDHRYWLAESGSWHVPTNWDTAPPPTPDPCAAAPPSANPGTPQAGDDVCINAASEATVNYSNGASGVNSISCQENLTVSGGTLSVASSTASFIQGDLQISGLGIFDVASAAALDVFGTLRMSSQNATLRGVGTTRAWGGMEISQQPIINNGHKLDNFGVATATGGLLVTNGSVFTNRPGALFDKQHGYYYAFLPGTGVFVNEGTFRKSAMDDVEVGVALVNDGLIHVQFDALSINPLFNAGSTSNGAFWGDAGTLLSFSGGNHFFYPGSTILADAVQFVNFGSGPIEIQGTYNVTTSTTLRSSQPITFTAGANVINYGATVNVQADARFNAVAGGPIAIDTLNVTSGAARFNSGDPIHVGTLNVGNQGGTVRGPSPITVSGLLTWNQAGHFFDQAAVNANGGLLVPAGTNVRSLNQRIFYNAGPATFLGSVDLAASATFNNLATGVMDVRTDGTLFGGGGPGQVINNSGTMRKSAGTGSSWIYVNVANTGTVEAQVGEIRFQNAAYVQSLGSTLLTGGSISAVTQGGTATGTLNFWGGDLRGDGVVSAHVANTAATVSPGLSAGVLNIIGNYTQSAAGELEIELGGPLGANHDWLNVTGTASLDGTLQVELISGFTPTVGEQFEVLTAGSVTGTFDTVESLTPGLDLNLIYSATTVILEIASALGDCDGDGDVDLDDYDLFDGCWSGPIAPYGPAGCDCIDADVNGSIDLSDFAAFQDAFTG